MRDQLLEPRPLVRVRDDVGVEVDARHGRKAYGARRTLAAMSTQPAAEFATITTDDLVTGEGVALDLPPASLGLRLASGLIDLVVTDRAVRGEPAGAPDRHDQRRRRRWSTLPSSRRSIITFAVYPTVLETLTRGRSLGKLALGLRTVRDDAGPITFHHALVRALIGFVEIYVLLRRAGVLLDAGQPARQAAGRLRRRHLRDPRPGRAPAPAPAADAAASSPTGPAHADLASLPTGLALAVRQFLGRLPTLDPHSRHRVGADLLTEVRRYVAPAPPAGAPPEVVLGAVIAERRDRDLARLRRDERVPRRRLAARD